LEGICKTNFFLWKCLILVLKKLGFRVYAYTHGFRVFARTPRARMFARGVAPFPSKEFLYSVVAFARKRSMKSLGFATSPAWWRVSPGPVAGVN
jgi:hypothetical protein